MLAAVTQKPLKRRYTPAERARHRQGQALRTAARLEMSALLAGDDDCLAIADAMRATASDKNVFHSVDQVNFATGELFDGIGALEIAVSSRFCHFYQIKQSARARRTVRAALDRVTPARGERWRFVTLTLPDLRADFEKTFDVLDYAVSLLKKRRWFKSNVRAGVFGSEFTVGAADHYHCHVHAIVCSNWLEHRSFKNSELARTWTDCVRRACAAHGIVGERYTGDGLAIVHVKEVTEKASGRGTIALDDAVNEVCKYLCKGSDVGKIPVDQLCEVEKALRGRQLVKSFGECNRRKGSSARRESDNHETPENTPTLLDTRNTIDAATGSKNHVRRGESLIKFGARMIKAGRRAEWLTFLHSTMDKRRAFRRLQLARVYSTATFYGLDGRVWSNEM